MAEGSGGPVASAIIAGVNKAGTTSLFVSLSGHPDVAPASVKETRYFLPLRWGQPLEPRSAYEAAFVGAGNRPVRLEATPSYFYGGAPVAAAMQQVCGPQLRVLVVLREPVSRLVSFFAFQKTRLRLPEDLSIVEYVAAADRMSDADFRDPQHEKWFGVRGGCYADFLPAWSSTFGHRLRVLFFEDLMARPDDVLHDVATFLEIDPRGFAERQLSSENRTMAFRNRGIQRLALGVNNRLERFLRRHYRLKDRLRAAYYRLNGRRATERVPTALREELEARYAEPNRRLAGMLGDAGVTTLPAWLERAPALR